MDLHYNRHHKTYVDNLNKAITAEAAATSKGDLVKKLELQSVIKFNAGGHINHSLFWASLAPASDNRNKADANAPSLHSAIEQHWKSFDAFKSAFEASALTIQGSGWQWLVKSPDNQTLDLVTSKDQDLPPNEKLIIFGVDMWEHAYYLQYFNNKKEYLTKVWDVINWTTAESRFKSNRQGIYGDLAGLAGSL